jgi:hypothetical protein
MTQLRTIDTAALAQLSKALVGFDRYFTAPHHQNGNYPPHNIVKYSEDTYAIEVAVAGFTKEEVLGIDDLIHEKWKTEEGERSLRSNRGPSISKPESYHNFKETFINSEIRNELQKSYKDILKQIKNL